MHLDINLHIINVVALLVEKSHIYPDQNGRRWKGRDQKT